MVKKSLVSLGFFVLTALTGQVAASPFITGIDANGGFESGFTGYLATMPGSSVVSSATAASGTVYNPTEGGYFAKIDSNSSNWCGHIVSGSCSLVSSFIHMEKGNTFQFNWAFLTDNHTDINDFGLFMLNVDHTILADVESVGDHGDTGWQTFSWTADDEFFGIVSWLALSPGATPGDTSLLVDNAQVLPEPGSIALLGLGLLGMAMSRRRKLP